MGLEYEPHRKGSQGKLVKHKLMKELILCFSFQLPDQFGGVRTLTTGKGSMLIVGTTKNCILQGTFSLNFSLVIQVRHQCIFGLVRQNIFSFSIGSYGRSIRPGSTPTAESVHFRRLRQICSPLGFDGSSGRLEQGHWRECSCSRLFTRWQHTHHQHDHSWSLDRL